MVSVAPPPTRVGPPPAVDAATARPPALLAPKAPARLWKSPPSPALADATWTGPLDPKLDAGWLARLAGAPIESVTLNRGGSSITLRARFADGQRAALKPEQRRWRVGHRAEIAAYHLDRALGLGRVAPVAGRRLPHAELRAHLVASGADGEWLARFDDEVTVREGVVEVAAIAWHSRTLVSVEPPRDWLDGLSADAPLRPALTPRLGEWSDMLVFDALIDNTDRWSGGNILGLGKDGPLILLDQAAGFNPTRREPVLDRRVQSLCRFRRETVAALAALRAGGAVKLLSTSLDHDALAPVLTPAQLATFDGRCELLERHIESCVERLGSERVHTLQSPPLDDASADTIPEASH